MSCKLVLQLDVLEALGHQPALPRSDVLCLSAVIALCFFWVGCSIPLGVSTCMVLSPDLAGSECAASAPCSHTRVQCPWAAEPWGQGPAALLSTGLLSTFRVREDAGELWREDFRHLLEMQPQLLILEGGSRCLSLLDAGGKL